MAEGGEVPEDLRYTKDHEWVRVEGDTAVVGVTDHAQQAVGEITYVDFPPVGDQARQFDELAAVESAKAAFDVFAVLSGTVSEVNAALEDAPEKVNADPYGDGWLCKLDGIDVAELDNLLTPEQYREILEREQQ
ncbi:MAG: glycine cleavage system protein GcvH [Candidatus Brocadiia bacterium]|nr:glycine cleavage system protein GcvH [Candidatus Brocadiia bacterium]